MLMCIVQWPVVLPTNTIYFTYLLTTMLVTGGLRDAHSESITTANLGRQKKKLENSQIYAISRIDTVLTEI